MLRNFRFPILPSARHRELNRSLAQVISSLRTLLRHDGALGAMSGVHLEVSDVAFRLTAGSQVTQTIGGGDNVHNAFSSDDVLKFFKRQRPPGTVPSQTWHSA